MVIDFHTHCFPEKIAQRAIEKLSFAAGGFLPYYDGSVNGLRQTMKAQGIDKSVVLSIATSAHQQKSVNDFASQINGGNLIAFGSVYPFSEDARDELCRIKELGLKGVKLHPDYQDFFVDDERLIPIYQQISKLGLIAVFHAGFDYGFPPPYHATPDRLAKIIKFFDTPVVAAHWGGMDCGEGVLKLLCGENIYFDTAFGYGSIPKYYAQKILEKHGTDKILFGTDGPWHTAELEMRLLNTLGLSPDDMDRILFRNAEKLLNQMP